MSEMNSSLYWIGALLSGVFITSVSAGGMWLLENKKPTAKTVGRDFILGGILFFILLQLVPESMITLLTGLVVMMPKMSGGGETESLVQNTIETLTVSSASALDEVEVRVGVPRF
uniref:Uncharacterized protein n=1 Tax=viral metagenome TaxID=1070528 RepID=A0A6C0JXV5_9ZZZZ